MSSRIRRSVSFREQLELSMCAMTRLFAQCEPAAPIGSAPLEDDDLFGFRVVGQQQRPSEFLQCWLDMVRVIFEPAPPGTMFLNSNWDLITAAVPEAPFRLQYLSVSSGSADGATALIKRHLEPRALELGCPISEAVACFAALCVGEELYERRMSLNKELQGTLGGGFTVDEALVAISEVAHGRDAARRAERQAHAGVTLDRQLSAGVMRISAWLFLHQHPTH
ncbi:hypothetical protein JJB11_21500 [Ramlibacter ginsenosidimutans]|uniref:Uncharacterized protein n=1 Tax=Ramlibacter ginsenosidimutans TaxID=502333 RepID=A0A934TWL7_9BURK|nr:hypothetical protein [Ramlibacter ginsenosidimutans]MBK6008685.1 hypothetical protein [Ramlibacter ginsenosidimutans]